MSVEYILSVQIGGKISPVEHLKKHLDLPTISDLFDNTIGKDNPRIVLPFNIKIGFRNYGYPGYS